MSRPPERENETPQGQPNVYHPRSAAPPAYEAYTDPAAAHGWQNAYDETAELPRVGNAGTAEGVGAGVAGGVGRRARRRARDRASRRLVIAAGAVGALSAAALIAGLSPSGSSPEGAPRGKQSGDGTSSTAAPSVDPTGASDTDPDTPRTSDATATPRADAPGTSPSPTASDVDDSTPSSTPSVASAAPSTPTATASTVTPGDEGRDDHPGRGLGKTKGPR